MGEVMTGDAPPRIPQLDPLDLSQCGDQETFIAMLENHVNALTILVNALVVAEFERERREGKPQIILPT